MFICGPFILFSNFGGTLKPNPVLDNSLRFYVQVNFTTLREEHLFNNTMILHDRQVLPFRIYENESPSIYDFDEEMFSKEQFDQWPETKFFTNNQV
jgi:hypothetical protein